jgi:hypothetical protein
VRPGDAGPRYAPSARVIVGEAGVRTVAPEESLDRSIRSPIDPVGDKAKPDVDRLNPDIDRDRLVKFRAHPDDDRPHPDIDRDRLVKFRVRPDDDRDHLVEFRLHPDDEP